MAIYELIVDNVGTVWRGANGAEARRQYGAAKKSADIAGGRDGWENVTLMRDCEPMFEHTPGPFWFIEVTDTFGGEANYSWVTRHKVRANTQRGAVWRVSRDSGMRWHSVGCERYDSKSGATCLFIAPWDDDCHSQYMHVREL